MSNGNPAPNLPPLMSGLETMQEVHRRMPGIEIRDEHIEALDSIASGDPGSDEASLIVMATSLGKTVVMAADTMRRHIREPHARTLFLSHRNNILNQNRDTFESIVGPEQTYGLFSGDGRDYDDLSILFASFQVMRGWHPAFMRTDFDFGQVDEAHHSKANTYEPTLRHFDFRHLLGVTATPDRLDVRDIRSIYGPEKFDLPLEEAILRRMVTQVEYHVITDEVVETGAIEDIAGNEYSISNLDKNLFAPDRSRQIADIAQEFAAKLPNPKTVGFCRSVEHAELMASMYENGVALHHRLPRKQQKQILEQMKKGGELDAVFVVDMFNEGIDIPDINQVLFLRETGSKAIYLQQLGRGLRKAPGKQKVQVLDFVDSPGRLLMIDRVWREIAKRSGEEPEEIDSLYIKTSEFHFDDRAVRVLNVLRRMEGLVYMPGQNNVPDGAIRMSTLANELSVSPGVLRALVSSLDIEPSKFPLLAGNVISYVGPQEAARIRIMASRAFPPKK